jgi:hypothetical protein
MLTAEPNAKSVNGLNKSTLNTPLRTLLVAIIVLMNEYTKMNNPNSTNIQPLTVSIDSFSVEVDLIILAIEIPKLMQEIAVRVHAKLVLSVC